jgi:hypothetical protein
MKEFLLSVWVSLNIPSAKVRISEQNTKQKEEFFIFACIFKQEDP